MEFLSTENFWNLMEIYFNVISVYRNHQSHFHSKSLKKEAIEVKILNPGKISEIYQKKTTKKLNQSKKWGQNFMEIVFEKKKKNF